MSGGRPGGSAGIRWRPAVSLLIAPPFIAWNRWSTMDAASFSALPGVRTAPSINVTPACFAKYLPASSNRITGRSVSNATTRAPMSMALIWRMAAFSHSASFEVPPPICTVSTRWRVRPERATAPDPNAAVRAHGQVIVAESVKHLLIDSIHFVENAKALYDAHMLGEVETTYASRVGRLWPDVQSGQTRPQALEVLRGESCRFGCRCR
jgi:hypothetical protein